MKKPSNPETNSGHELSTAPRRRYLLRPRWCFAALLLAVLAWPCWNGFAYLSAVSEVKANATWTDDPLGTLLRAIPGVTKTDDFRLLVLFKGRDLKCIGHLLPRLCPTNLEAEECMAVDLDALKGLDSLRDITFRSCPSLQNLDGLKGLTALQGLTLCKCTALENVDAISGLTGLQSLLIDGSNFQRNVDVLTGLTGLQNLTLMNCSNLQNVDAIKGLTGLQYLALGNCPSLENVDVIKGLSGLQRLDLTGCTGIPLSALRDIRTALPDADIFFPDGSRKAPPP